MKAARCASALCGGKPNDLAASTAGHRLNFLAARLNGTENPPKRTRIWRMSAYISQRYALTGQDGETNIPSCQGRKQICETVRREGLEAIGIPSLTTTS